VYKRHSLVSEQNSDKEESLLVKRRNYDTEKYIDVGMYRGPDSALRIYYEADPMSSYLIKM
jgi:hypothetical protein